MGIGYNLEIVIDKVGNDWVFYYVVVIKYFEGCVLMMDKISWKDGWFVVVMDFFLLKLEKFVL